jgi:hypothetical protein
MESNLTSWVLFYQKENKKGGEENRLCRRRRRRCAAEMEVEAGSRVEMVTE